MQLTKTAPRQQKLHKSTTTPAELSKASCPGGVCPLAKQPRYIPFPVKIPIPVHVPVPVESSPLPVQQQSSCPNGVCPIQQQQQQQQCPGGVCPLVLAQLFAAQQQQQQQQCPGGVCPLQQQQQQQQCPGGVCPLKQQQPQQQCPGGVCPLVANKFRQQQLHYSNSYPELPIQYSPIPQQRVPPATAPVLSHQSNVFNFAYY